MTSDQLREKLNQFEEGKIVSYGFDLSAHTIFFDIEPPKDVDLVNQKVIFHQVSSFYFIHDSRNLRFKIEEESEGSYNEFTSISYFEKGIGKIYIKSTVGDWVDQWYSSANFAIEIWYSMLFIEAESISINAKTFEVGYPYLQEDLK